jgi:hypothetical protein
MGKWTNEEMGLKKRVPPSMTPDTLPSMTSFTLPFLVHQIYPYLSPLDQLNLVRAGVSSSMNMQYHLTKFFDNVAGVAWSTLRELLRLAHAFIGGPIVALFFSPVWYRIEVGGIEIFVDGERVHHMDVLLAFCKAFWKQLLPEYQHIDFLMQHYLYTGHVEVEILNNCGVEYLIRLFNSIPVPTSTADSNFIAYDSALCKYYNYAKNRQISPLAPYSRLSLYLKYGYQRPSFLRRIWNWIFFKGQIPVDNVRIPFETRQRSYSLDKEHVPFSISI